MPLADQPLELWLGQFDAESSASFLSQKHACHTVADLVGGLHTQKAKWHVTTCTPLSSGTHPKRLTVAVI